MKCSNCLRFYKNDPNVFFGIEIKEKLKECTKCKNIYNIDNNRVNCPYCNHKH